MNREVEKINMWAMSKVKNFRTYIDIGAHNGDTSLPFINKFKKIICFEPNPESFSKLKTNPLLECYNIALGDNYAKGELSMNDFTKDPRHGSLVRHRDGNGKKFEIIIKPLDSFKFFQDVDFIKIDTEQYELPVIKGAIKTLKKNRPTIMFENKRNEADEALILLLEIGFTVRKYKSDTIAYYE